MTHHPLYHTLPANEFAHRLAIERAALAVRRDRYERKQQIKRVAGRLFWLALGAGAVYVMVVMHIL